MKLDHLDECLLVAAHYEPLTIEKAGVILEEMTRPGRIRERRGERRSPRSPNGVEPGSCPGNRGYNR